MKRENWRIEPIKWQKTLYAESNKKALVLIDDGNGNLYTEIAWLNEFHEWVDIPHLHSVLYFAELTEELQEWYNNRTN